MDHRPIARPGKAALAAAIAAQAPTTSIRSDDAARLVERYASIWLRESSVGQELIGQRGLDAALDAVFAELNAGRLKFTNTNSGLAGLHVVDPPQRPRRPLVRPSR